MEIFPVEKMDKKKYRIKLDREIFHLVYREKRSIKKGRKKKNSERRISNLSEIIFELSVDVLSRNFQFERERGGQ